MSVRTLIIAWRGGTVTVVAQWLLSAAPPSAISASLGIAIYRLNRRNLMPAPRFVLRMDRQRTGGHVIELLCLVVNNAGADLRVNEFGLEVRRRWYSRR